MRAGPVCGEHADGIFVRILGPLRVTVGRRDVRLGRSRQLAALALLLINANKPVSVARLIDGVWGGDPPPTADKQVQTCVWRLRSAFQQAGAPIDPIETGRGGYLFRLPDGAMDAQLFEQTTAQARRKADNGELDDAVRDYRAAAGLFRGLPLAEFDSQAICSVAAYWEERRLSAIEQRLDIELSMGRHAELISELRMLVTEHPLRERLRAQLMTALHLAHRRADALAVYRGGRALMINHVGLEPGAQLRDIHDKIITDGVIAPATSKPNPRTVKVPAQLPADVADFTGWTTHLKWLTQALRQFGARPSVVALTGLAGVGKSTMAVHAAHRVREHFPDGQLHADFKGGIPVTDVLRGFLDAFGVPAKDVPEDVGGRRDMFRGIAKDKRVLVLLDNADGCRQIDALLPGGASAVLITSQASVSGVPDVVQRRLTGLSADESVELLGAICGTGRIAAEPQAAHKIAELCGYLPLAVRAAAARLNARPMCRLRRLAERLADKSQRIRELSYRSLDTGERLAGVADRLPAAARDLWLRLSLLDIPEVPTWAAAAVAGEHQDVPQLLDVLVAHQALDIVGKDVLGGYRHGFHPLVRVHAQGMACGGLSLVTHTTVTRRFHEASRWLMAHARRDPDSGPPPFAVERIGWDIVRGVAARATEWLHQERAIFAAVDAPVIARPRRPLDDEAVLSSYPVCDTEFAF